MPEPWQPGQTQQLMLQGPAGALEALLETPATAAEPAGLMLICHPHPQHGGSMSNKVAHTLARSALNSGLAALRFNFRGVGASEGSFADGVGETEDALAALQWLRQQAPEAPFVVAGFSFGAAVALRLAARSEASFLLTVAPPLSYFEAGSVPEPACPWLVVHGDADDVVDCADTLSRIRAQRLAVDHRVLAGAGHFFHGRLAELREIAQTALQARWSELV